MRFFKFLTSAKPAQKTGISKPELKSTRRTLIAKKIPPETASDRKTDNHLSFPEGMLEKFTLLFKKSKESLKNGILIYLEKLSGVKNLKEIEKIIIIYYLHNELNSRTKYYDSLFKPENILEFLSSIYKKNKIDFVSYFLPNSPLFKKDIFNMENYHRDSGLRFDIRFKTETLEYLLTGWEPLKNKRKSASIVINLPMDIFQRLDAKIISQEKAKKFVSVIAFQHLNRFPVNPKKQTAPRLNMLLIGPTGCGKTYMAKTLAQVLNVPIAFCDATQYTETGYVGANVEDMLVSLYKAADKDYKKMGSFVIIVDIFLDLTTHSADGFLV
jgi:flagellar biosynthesis GTPase FlhF